jgi:hypothetical protein
MFDLEFLYSSLITITKFFSHDVLLNTMEKIKQTYLFPFFERCYFIKTINFDL